jgi:hypothetical protein
MIMALWTITNFTGGSSGEKLVGCRLMKNNRNYEFIAPDNAVLAATKGLMFPFHFNFHYDTWDWTVTVTTIDSGASGHWENSKPNITAEEGSWSAGAGTDPKNKTKKTTKKQTRAAGK